MKGVVSNQTWSPDEWSHYDPSDGQMLERAEVTLRDLLEGQPTISTAKPRVNNGWMTLGEGSEAEYREDELVCPVANLTYYSGLAKSPYTDDQGNLAF